VELDRGYFITTVFLDMYADELIAGLEKSDLRCHFGSVCIANADDIILISESVTVLQKMLDMQCGPKNRIPSFIFGITLVIQYHF